MKISFLQDRGVSHDQPSDVQQDLPYPYQLLERLKTGDFSQMPNNLTLESVFDQWLRENGALLNRFYQDFQEYCRGFEAHPPLPNQTRMLEVLETIASKLPCVVRQDNDAPDNEGLFNQFIQEVGKELQLDGNFKPTAEYTTSVKAQISALKDQKELLTRLQREFSTAQEMVQQWPQTTPYWLMDRIFSGLMVPADKQRTACENLLPFTQEMISFIGSLLNPPVQEATPSSIAPLSSKRARKDPELTKPPSKKPNSTPLQESFLKTLLPLKARTMEKECQFIKNGDMDGLMTCVDARMYSVEELRLLRSELRKVLYNIKDKAVGSVKIDDKMGLVCNAMEVWRVMQELEQREKTSARWLAHSLLALGAQDTTKQQKAINKASYLKLMLWSAAIQVEIENNSRRINNQHELLPQDVLHLSMAFLDIFKKVKERESQLYLSGNDPQKPLLLEDLTLNQLQALLLKKYPSRYPSPIVQKQDSERRQNNFSVYFDRYPEELDMFFYALLRCKKFQHFEEYAQIPSKPCEKHIAQALHDLCLEISGEELQEILSHIPISISKAVSRELSSRSFQDVPIERQIQIEDWAKTFVESVETVAQTLLKLHQAQGNNG